MLADGGLELVFDRQLRLELRIMQSSRLIVSELEFEELQTLVVQNTTTNLAKTGRLTRGRVEDVQNQLRIGSRANNRSNLATSRRNSSSQFPTATEGQTTRRTNLKKEVIVIRQSATSARRT